MAGDDDSCTFLLVEDAKRGSLFLLLGYLVLGGSTLIQIFCFEVSGRVRSHGEKNAGGSVEKAQADGSTTRHSAKRKKLVR